MIILKSRYLYKYIFRTNQFTLAKGIIDTPNQFLCKIQYYHYVNNSKLNFSTNKIIPPDSSLKTSNYIKDWSEIIKGWYKKYQDFVGITQILEAQDKVTLLTNQLLSVQSERRRLQKEVESIHQQLLSTHQRITKSELYSEDHYSLFEKARELSASLKGLQTKFSETEEEERSLFTHLSTAIQFCHEKERTQSEHSKYWSILISVISAALASLITSINNWVRIKEIKDHASSLHNDVLDKTSHFHSKILSALGNNVSDSVKIDSEFVNTQSLTQSIQTYLHEEVNRLVNVLKESYQNPDNLDNSEIDVLAHHPHTSSQDVSSGKIAGSMFMGVMVGTLITSLFYGFTRGTG